MLRHRRVPTRTFANRVIVARPLDGTALVLGPTAASVWRLLDSWVSTSEVDAGLGVRFPDVPEHDRLRSSREILALLDDEGLLERR